jgi:hypothetical protein
MADLSIQSEQFARLGMKRTERTVIHDQSREIGINVQNFTKKEAQSG